MMKQNVQTLGICRRTSPLYQAVLYALQQVVVMFRQPLPWLLLPIPNFNNNFRQWSGNALFHSDHGRQLPFITDPVFIYFRNCRIMRPKQCRRGFIGQIRLHNSVL
jgi:hypothetical protein